MVVLIPHLLPELTKLVVLTELVVLGKLMVLVEVVGDSFFYCDQLLYICYIF